MPGIYPSHALENALAQQPATVHDLVALLQPDYPTTIQNTLDPDARARAERVRQVFRNSPDHGGASPLDHAHGWDLVREEGFWYFAGHAYVVNGRIDPESPLILINRHDLSATIGPELVDLARSVLSHALLYDALRD